MLNVVQCRSTASRSGRGLRRWRCVFTFSLPLVFFPCFPSSLPHAADTPHQPYTFNTGTSSWTRSSSSFAEGSLYRLTYSDIPLRAVKLVRQEQREKKFGDFDDHLEDVTIGGCLSFLSDVRVGWGIVSVVIARVVEVDA